MQSAFIHILLGRTPAASEASPNPEGPEQNAEDGSAFASLLAGLRTLLPSGSTDEASPTPRSPTAGENPPPPSSAGAPAPLLPVEEKVLPVEEEAPPPAGPTSTPPTLPSLKGTPSGPQAPSGPQISSPAERPAPDTLQTGGHTDVRGDAAPERAAHVPGDTEEAPSPPMPSTRVPEAPEPHPAGRRQPSASALPSSPTPALPSSSEQSPPAAASLTSAPLASPEESPPADPPVEENPEARSPSRIDGPPERNEPVPSRASTGPTPEEKEPELSSDAGSETDGGSREQGEQEKASPSETHRSAGDRAAEREPALSRSTSSSPEVAERPPAAEAEPDTPAPEPPEVVSRQEAAAPQAGSTSGPIAAQAAHRPTAVGAAWLQALIARNVQQIGLQDGWQHLQVDLEEGQGTVTFRVRREDDRVAVRIGFSDPALRALAQNHAERLHEALQAEYGTTVDFSLSGDSGPADGGSGQEPGGIRTTPTEPESDFPPSPASLRTLIQGARHEWIG